MSGQGSNALSRSLELVRHCLNRLSEFLVFLRQDDENIAFGEIIRQLLLLRFIGEKIPGDQGQVIKFCSMECNRWSGKW
jgi:hypothetical protein